MTSSKGFSMTPAFVMGGVCAYDVHTPITSFMWGPFFAGSGPPDNCNVPKIYLFCDIQTVFGKDRMGLCGQSCHGCERLPTTVYRGRLDRWPCHVTVVEKESWFLQGLVQACVTHMLPDGICMGKSLFYYPLRGFRPNVLQRIGKKGERLDDVFDLVVSPSC